ncbi:hypothetical protein, partial [Shigella sp. SHS-4]|uniref:hypothetical protein n=1 Tax=Shigella sp. SHS-4 TaxID=2116503 RepID=UPI001C0A7C07
SYEVQKYFVVRANKTKCLSLMREARFEKGVKQFGSLFYSNPGPLNLVVWGLNLSSTMGSKFTCKELAMVQLAPYQYSVIIWIMLSDA